MIKFLNGLRKTLPVFFIVILLSAFLAPPVMAASNSTTTGSLELIPTFECISVYANFSNDGNKNNQATLEYRKAGGTWKQGMALTVDRRAQIMSNHEYITNPFVNQWRGSIIGLTPNTQYQVRVTFIDADGVTGANPVTGYITTRNDVFTPGNGNSYHVATYGNNGNSGDSGHPWRTIQHALNSVSAGDTVYIHAGTYRETLNMTASGTPNNYITITNYGSDNVIVDFGNAKEGFILNGASCIRIRGITLQNADETCLVLRNASNYCVIENNTIRDYGYVVPDAGIQVGSESSYNLIQYNTITTDRNDNADYHRADGINLWRDSPYSFYPGIANVIRYNTIYGGGSPCGMGDGIGGIENEKYNDGPYKDTDIYNNTIGPVADDGLEVEGGNINVRVWGNKIYSKGYAGIALAPVIVGPFYVFRNVIYDVSSVANKIGDRPEMYTGHAYVYHNSAYGIQTEPNYTRGIAPWGGVNFSNHHYLNNIFRVSSCALNVPNPSSNPANNNTFNYDCLYAGGSSYSLEWNDNYYSTLSAFQAASGQELNGISADPLFVNPNSGNLQLQSGSPCIDAGVIIPGFNDANSRWSYSGNAPDMGAYEYGGGPAIDTTPPYTTGHSPAKSSTSVSPNTNIVVHVRDNGTGVDQNSIVMRVNGATVSPTITGTSYDYTVTYNPPVDFAYQQVVSVSINAQDLQTPPNTMPQDNYTFTIRSEAEPPSGDWPILPFRVNCAGADYTDVYGNLWNADQAYSTGNWGFYGSDNTIDRGTGVAISNTQDDRLFQTERYGLDGYRFDLDNGTYDISLLFAETYYSSTGKRIFDVYVEGQLKLDNLDVCSRVGSKTALIETISSITVTDGQLNISFGEVTELPMLNGIMIIQSGGNQPPVALNDYYSTESDNTLSVASSGVLGNDSDINGDSLSAVILTDVSHGNLTLNSDGSFIYTPDEGYTGSDTFSYRANDGQVNSNIATVIIYIAGDGSSDGDGEDGTSGGDSNVEITSVLNYVSLSGKFSIEVIAQSSDNIVQINIPKDTVGTDSMGVRLINIAIEKMILNTPTAPNDAVIVGSVYSITPDDANFEPAISLTMSYSDNQIPYGVAEKNLIIGTFNPGTGEWETIPSSINLVDNTVTASLEHFSTYALLAYTRPASFEIADISTPDIVTCGSNIDIQVTVINTGDLTGDYEVRLMLDGEVFDTELITLDGGDSTIVIFNTTTDVPGSHRVSIGVVEKTFTAEAYEAPAEFITSNINVTPSVIYLGESVDITTLISNIGDLPGVYETVLKIDNEFIDSRNVNINGGDSEIITFTLTPETEGEHAINIGNKVVFFTVKSTENVDVDIITMAKPEIIRFDITPTYNPGTGKIESTRIDYQIINSENLDAGSTLILKVFRNGELWEEISLITLDQVETDQDTGYLSYVPAAGWSIGTYIFEAELQEPSGVVHSIQFEKFKLIDESLTKSISWGSLGIIIGGTLIVLLTLLAIVIYHRREMLRGYVE